MLKIISRSRRYCKYRSIWRYPAIYWKISLISIKAKMSKSNKKSWTETLTAPSILALRAFREEVFQTSSLRKYNCLIRVVSYPKSHKMISGCISAKIVSCFNRSLSINFRDSKTPTVNSSIIFKILWIKPIWWIIKLVICLISRSWRSRRFPWIKLSSILSKLLRRLSKSSNFRPIRRSWSCLSILIQTSPISSKESPKTKEECFRPFSILYRIVLNSRKLVASSKSILMYWSINPSSKKNKSLAIPTRASSPRGWILKSSTPPITRSSRRWTITTWSTNKNMRKSSSLLRIMALEFQRTSRKNCFRIIQNWMSIRKLTIKEQD